MSKEIHEQQANRKLQLNQIQYIIHNSGKSCSSFRKVGELKNAAQSMCRTRKQIPHIFIQFSSIHLINVRKEKDRQITSLSKCQIQILLCNL